MILLPGCKCCCPCGPDTLPWTAANHVSSAIHFANGQSFGICQDEGSTLTLNSASQCEYYSDYEVTDPVTDTICTVRIFYIVNGPGCVFTVNGFSSGCSTGIVAVSVDEAACS